MFIENNCLDESTSLIFYRGHIKVFYYLELSTVMEIYFGVVLSSTVKR